MPHVGRGAEGWAVPVSRCQGRTTGTVNEVSQNLIRPPYPWVVGQGPATVSPVEQAGMAVCRAVVYDYEKRDPAHGALPGPKGAHRPAQLRPVHHIHLHRGTGYGGWGGWGGRRCGQGTCRCVMTWCPAHGSCRCPVVRRRPGHRGDGFQCTTRPVRHARGVRLLGWRRPRGFGAVRGRPRWAVASTRRSAGLFPGRTARSPRGGGRGGGPARRARRRVPCGTG